jgi:hypothetical protein
MSELMSMRAIATAVAKEMGDGWTIEAKKRDYAHYSEMTGPLGERIGFASNRTKNMIHVSGSFNDRDAHGHVFWSVPRGKASPEINVSMTKTVQQIAADIRRRLLPAYSELFKDNLQKWQQTAAHRATTHNNANEIANALGTVIPTDTGRSNNPDTIEISLYNVPRLPEASGRISVYADQVTFQRLCVSADECVAIIDLIATMRAEAQAHATIAASGRGCPKGGGWAIFNESEIQRDDEAKIFAHDDEAKEHIAGCKVCKAMLTIEASNLGLNVENLLKPEAQGDCPHDAGTRGGICEGCGEEI